MRALTVLYDSHCGLCRRVKDWLTEQPAYLALEFLAAGSPEADARYPSLDHARTLSELTAISDEGGVYRGEDAFLICLYALYDYRGHSLWLGTPSWRPVFRLGLSALEALRGTTACDGECGLGEFMPPARSNRRSSLRRAHARRSTRRPAYPTEGGTPSAGRAS